MPVKGIEAPRRVNYLTHYPDEQSKDDGVVIARGIRQPRNNERVCLASGPPDAIQKLKTLYRESNGVHYSQRIVLSGSEELLYSIIDEDYYVHPDDYYRDQFKTARGCRRMLFGF